MNWSKFREKKNSNKNSIPRKLSENSKKTPGSEDTNCLLLKTQCMGSVSVYINQFVCNVNKSEERLNGFSLAMRLLYVNVLQQNVPPSHSLYTLHIVLC